MPNLVLEQFQKDELYCFTVSDPQQDLQVCTDGVYTASLYRATSKRNDGVVYPSKHVIHISKKHNGLSCENSLYTLRDTVISQYSSQSYTCHCVTFQEEGVEDQFIVADWHEELPLFRGISASQKEILIWGVKSIGKPYLPIPHETRKNQWATLLVEWCNIKAIRVTFIINTKEIH